MVREYIEVDSALRETGLPRSLPSICLGCSIMDLLEVSRGVVRKDTQMAYVEKTPRLSARTNLPGVGRPG